MRALAKASRKAVLVLLLSAGVLAAVGCAQKELSPDAAVALSERYPLRDGMRLSYLHSSGGGWTERLEIEAIDGEPDRFVQRQSGNPDGSTAVHVLERDGGRVLRVSAEELLDGELVQTVRYEPGFLRFDEAWAEVDPGFEEQNEYTRTETNAGEAAMPSESRAQAFTVESVSDSVTVPAGTFHNCVRVRRVRADSTDAGATGEDEGKLYWFAPGVGKVREENLVSGKTEVLSSFEAPDA